MREPMGEIRRGAAVWIVFSALFFVFFAGPCHFRESYLLANDTKQTMAVLTEKQQHGVYSYKYSVADREYSGASQRNWESEKYRNVEVGERAVVFYSASHPWISSLEEPQSLPRDTGFYVGVPFVIGVAIVLILWKRPKGVRAD
jgi:hypothetical protein